MDSNSIRQYLSIGPELVPRWLTCFKVLHYDHLLSCRANAAWRMQWRYREKRKWSRATWKCKIFYIAKFWIFFFFRKCPLQFSWSLLCMLLAHIEKRSNSRLQIFSKTGVLKNFAIFTRKNLCWSFFLIKFQNWRPTFFFKKRLQRRFFSVNIGNF